MLNNTMSYLTKQSSKYIQKYFGSNKNSALSREDVFDVGEYLYYILNNSINYGRVFCVGIKDEGDKVSANYAITDGKNIVDIYHRNVAKTKEELVEKIS